MAGYSTFVLGYKFLHYWISASNGKGHGVHSPFVFDLITSVLNDKRHYYAYDRVEGLRALLQKDKRMIEVTDLGAGSSMITTNQRSVASIAKMAAKSPKLGQLLFRMVVYYKPTRILELGTSLGISTLYLASGNEQMPVVTLEGSAAVAEVAQQNFRTMALGNIRSVIGNFDDILPELIEAEPGFDMVFIDGNHRLEPTLAYFDQLKAQIPTRAILIFDDIHWSEEMEEAWDRIKKDPSVMLSVDLFFIGIIFFDPAFKVPQHFRIRF